jgi:hypothetical protein
MTALKSLLLLVAQASRLWSVGCALCPTLAGEDARPTNLCIMCGWDERSMPE